MQCLDNIGRRITRALCGSVVAALLLGAWTPGFAQTDEFQPERLKDGVALPSDMPRLYVADFSIEHLMDSRVRVLDARSGAYKGVIDTGYTGQFAVSPDGHQGFVVATYLSRHSHGQRTDALEIVDLDTLRVKGEVILPAKHAQAIFMHELLRPSADGRFVFVQNATPATSVTVVDIVNRKVLAELPTPGCWAIYPSKTEALRFSMLCGDGTLATLTLAADGTVAGKSTSTRFFDPDQDPVFVGATDDGVDTYFVSYLGQLIQTNLNDAAPVIVSQKSIVGDADRHRNWRPGGYQLLAFDRAAGRLLVGMHANGAEGSHKNPAQEIWGIDVRSGRRIFRQRAANAISMTVNQASHTLFALDATTNRIHAYNLADKFRSLYVSDPAGEAPTQIEAP